MNTNIHINTNDSVHPLAGRTAVVTGSGRHLGRGIALGFARAGANVVLAGHSDMNALKAVAAEAQALGVQALCVLADVTKPEEMQAMADEAIKRFGKIDIAVQNVGLRP